MSVHIKVLDPVSRLLVAARCCTELEPRAFASLKLGWQLAGCASAGSSASTVALPGPPPDLFKNVSSTEDPRYLGGESGARWMVQSSLIALSLLPGSDLTGLRSIGKFLRGSADQRNTDRTMAAAELSADGKGDAAELVKKLAQSLVSSVEFIAKMLSLQPQTKVAGEQLKSLFGKVSHPQTLPIFCRAYAVMLAELSESQFSELQRIVCGEALHESAAAE